MSYVFFLLNLLAVTFLLARWRWLNLPGLPRYAIPLLFICKVFSGYILGLYYLKLYKGGGDIYGFLGDAEVMYRFFLQDKIGFMPAWLGFGEFPAEVAASLKSWYGSGYHERYLDSRTVIRFHTLIRMISGGNLWVNLLWSNLAALLGFLLLVRFFFEEELVSYRQSATLVLLPALLPNVLIWSSALLKEPLMMLAIGAVLYGLKQFLKKPSCSGITGLALALILFVSIRSFWLLLMLPGLLAYAFSRNKPRTWSYFLFAYSITLVLVAFIGQWIPYFNLPELMYGEQRNMWKFAIYMKSGSLIHPVGLAPEWDSLLRRIPEAIVYGLFQPFPSNIRGIGYLPTLLENWVLPVMLLLLLFKARFLRLKGPFPQVWLCVYAGLGMIAVSAFTTPVLGTLVRYRMPGLLLLVMAALFLLMRSRRLPAS